MAEKEVWFYLLAYNLIRIMMAEAALFTEQLPRQLSFKHIFNFGWLGVAVDLNIVMGALSNCCCSSLNRKWDVDRDALNPGP